MIALNGLPGDACASVTFPESELNQSLEILAEQSLPGVAHVPAIFSEGQWMSYKGLIIRGQECRAICASTGGHRLARNGLIAADLICCPTHLLTTETADCPHDLSVLQHGCRLPKIGKAIR